MPNPSTLGRAQEKGLQQLPRSVSPRPAAPSLFQVGLNGLDGLLQRRLGPAPSPRAGCRSPSFHHWRAARGVLSSLRRRLRSITLEVYCRGSVGPNAGGRGGATGRFVTPLVLRFKG